jgi:hypothetical protein
MKADTIGSLVETGGLLPIPLAGSVLAGMGAVELTERDEKRDNVKGNIIERIDGCVSNCLTRDKRSAADHLYSQIK